MIQIYLKEIKSIDDTTELGNDEIYTIVVAVNYTSLVNISGFSVPLPSIEVVAYDPVPLSKGERFVYGEAFIISGGSSAFSGREDRPANEEIQPFWSLTNKFEKLTNPDDVIFIVSVMENDDDDIGARRAIIKGLVTTTVFNSLSFSRDDKVRALIRDIQSASGTPTGFLSNDERIGRPKELKFDAAELQKAEIINNVRKKIRFVRPNSGDGGTFDLTFETRNKGFVVAWEDDQDGNGSFQIRARGFANNGSKKFSNRFPDFTVNSAPNGQQLKPQISLNKKGDFVIVWEDDQDDNGFFQIKARGFNANFLEKFSDITVNSIADGQQLKPQIAMDEKGAFVVVWEDDQDANDFFQIKARGFNSNGSENFPDITVNSVANGQQLKPQIAMNEKGDFVIVWEDDQDGGGFFQIKARGFNSDGSEIFPDITVNSVAAGQQLKPQIAMNEKGDFVVVWEDDQDENGLSQIKARGFNSNGSEHFSDITVNSIADGQQLKPQVGMSEKGDFVVVWEDDKDGNGLFQIKARGFNSNGLEKFSDRFDVNSVADGQQRSPQVFMDPEGDFVVVWEDDQDENGFFQIKARGFNSNGSEHFSEITVNSVARGQQLKPCIN